MEKNSIQILSGPINSGKTTQLLEWCNSKKNVYGILSPKINNKRFFMDVHSKTIFDMEAEVGEDSKIAVGKYIFSTKAFEHAEEILEQSLQQKSGHIIIDEIGPLEFKGSGFNNILIKILQNKNSSQHLILVVRGSLTIKLIEKYGIKNFDHFDKNKNPALY